MNKIGFPHGTAWQILILATTLNHSSIFHAVFTDDPQRKAEWGGGGGDSDPFWTEMGPFFFLASSEWHEWINFHSKWVSYWPGHSIWVPFAFISHSG